MASAVGGVSASAQAASPATPGAPTARIIGGVAVDKATEPAQYFAHLSTYWGSRQWGLCGATVISAHWLVTAQHCVTDPDNHLILRRSYVQIDPIDGNRGTRTKITRIVRHHGFNFNKFHNDIALLRVRAPILTPAIQLSATPVAAGAEFEVIGFGSTTRDGETQSDVLRRTLVNEMACTAYGREYHRPTMICAGSVDGRRDSCSGDSGGPLLSATASGVVQVGIVSWGQGCGSRRFPGVYTRMSREVSWVKRITGVAAV